MQIKSTKTDAELTQMSTKVLKVITIFCMFKKLSSSLGDIKYKIQVELQEIEAILHGLMAD